MVFVKELAEITIRKNENKLYTLDGTTHVSKKLESKLSTFINTINIVVKILNQTRFLVKVSNRI
jgi:hypothetical protein